MNGWLIIGCWVLTVALIAGLYVDLTLQVNGLNEDLAVADEQYTEILRQINNYNMVLDNNELELVNTSGWITGIYFSKEGYTKIMLKNRSWSQVMETCSHEYLHHKWGSHFRYKANE